MEVRSLLIVLVLSAAFSRDAATGQALPSPLPAAQTNGALQTYWLGDPFGYGYVQPMIFSNRPFAWLFMSNQYGVYTLREKAVTNSGGEVLGYEVNSYYPPPRRQFTYAYAGRPFLVVTNPPGARWFTASYSSNLGAASISDTTDLTHWTNPAALSLGVSGALSVAVTNIPW